MIGINSGLLVNATPLSASQEAELEMRSLAEGNTAYAYLNADNQICFILHKNPELIKKLAWHYAYEISSSTDGTLTKKVYKKNGLDTFNLTDVLLKPSYEESWLPQEYQRVDYLENNGTQFINLGIKPDNSTSVAITYQVLPTSIGHSQYILGARYSKTSIIDYGLNGSSSNDVWNARFTNNVIQQSALTRDSHIIHSSIILNNGTGEWQLTDLACDVQEVTPLRNIEVASVADLYLFAFNEANIHHGLRVYGCKIYRSNQLIADLIPCYHKNDNIAGMFDAVNKHFYTNNGTGTFAYA